MGGAVARRGEAVRPATHSRYESLFRLQLLPELGRVPIARLTPSMVSSALNRRHAAGVAPRTVAHARAVLRQALGAALTDGLVARNVASLDLRVPRITEREIDVLTPAQANALLAAARSDRLYALFLTALGTGARQGELLALR